MTALKRQKARVTKMRQCMTAASVIQRAWRRHKTRTKLNYLLLKTDNNVVTVHYNQEFLSWLQDIIDKINFSQ